MSRKTKNYEFEDFTQGPNANLLRELAIYSIKTFFEDKSYFCGGSIPRKEILNEKAIKMVLNTKNTDENFVCIHACIDQLPKAKRVKDWNAKVIINLLNDMKKNLLPRDFQPGLILLYFKVCKGVKIEEIMI